MKKLILIGVGIMFLVMDLKAQDSLTSDNPEMLFNFWVGKWKVTWEEQDGGTGSGINEINRILDEKVINENFQITEGKNKGFKGTSISVFQKQFNVWRQAWADNAGGYFSFRSEVDGDKKIFITEIFERGEKKIQQRMVFHSIEQDSLIWDWQLSEDGGKNWDLKWRIFYERIE